MKEIELSDDAVLVIRDCCAGEFSLEIFVPVKKSSNPMTKDNRRLFAKLLQQAANKVALLNDSPPA